ncbi:hypothetical protein PMAYCL1PPCAC_11467, partial [Pristionchus mayeri]
YPRRVSMNVVKGRKSIPSLFPFLVNSKITKDVEVMVTTFYLGNKCYDGKPKHTWRLFIRLNNLSRNTAVILRDRY